MDFVTSKLSGQLIPGQSLTSMRWTLMRRADIWRWPLIPVSLKLGIVTTKTQIQKINAHSGELRSIAWSPDGTMLVSGALGDSFKVWNFSNGEKVTTLDTGPNSTAGSAAWSPDGSCLATLSWWGDVSLWDTKHWQRIYRLPHQVGNEWCIDGQRGLAWSPTGDRLAARLSGWLAVWDTKTGQQLFTIRAHVTYATCVAWSPDGSRIATGSADHTIRIWNAETGEEMLTLKAGDKTGIKSLSWSPDGKILASGGETLKLWDASSAYVKNQ